MFPSEGRNLSGIRGVKGTLLCGTRISVQNAVRLYWIRRWGQEGLIATGDWLGYGIR